jgi:hypothetical protein
MNIVNESCLITAAPAEILVGLAIFFCISGVILFALALEAGNYPMLVCWIARLGRHYAGARRERGFNVPSNIWHAFSRGYEYD